MEVFGCGYNGFGQLDFINLNTRLAADTKTTIKVKQKDEDDINKSNQWHINPSSLFALSNDVHIENFMIFFSWSKCIAGIKIKEDKSVTLVAGSDTIQTQTDVAILENLLCTAVLNESLLLREVENPNRIRRFHNGSVQPFPISIRSDENEASVVNLQHVTGGHKDFYAVYNGVSLGKFKISDSVQDLDGQKCEKNASNISELCIKINHIDFVTPIKQICCGKEHVSLLTKSGNVYSYGLSSRGQLGHGEIERESSPRLIDALDGLRVEVIAAGGWHSAAVSDIGDLYTWGWNESGQLGLVSSNDRESLDGKRQEEATGIVTVPTCVDVGNGKNVKDVACGSRHSVVLTDQGQVFTCGWNKYGQLGTGDTANRNKLTCVENIVSCKIFAGHWNSAFVCKKDKL